MSTEISPELIDRVLELYCDWRTGLWDARAAYARFLDAPAPDRTLAFAAYTAALDQEESACEAYEAQIRAIQSQCSGGTSHAQGSHASLS
jgi:hypothetical protein